MTAKKDSALSMKKNVRFKDMIIDGRCEIKQEISKKNRSEQKKASEHESFLQSNYGFITNVFGAVSILFFLFCLWFFERDILLKYYSTQPTVFEPAIGGDLFRVEIVLPLNESMISIGALNRINFQLSAALDFMNTQVSTASTLSVALSITSYSLKQKVEWGRSDFIGQNLESDVKFWNKNYFPRNVLPSLESVSVHIVLQLLS